MQGSTTVRGTLSKLRFFISDGFLWRIFYSYFPISSFFISISTKYWFLDEVFNCFIQMNAFFSFMFMTFMKCVVLHFISTWLLLRGIRVFYIDFFEFGINTFMQYFLLGRVYWGCTMKTRTIVPYFSPYFHHGFVCYLCISKMTCSSLYLKLTNSLCS